MTYKTPSNKDLNKLRDIAKDIDSIVEGVEVRGVQTYDLVCALGSLRWRMAKIMADLGETTDSINSKICNYEHE